MLCTNLSHSLPFFCTFVPFLLHTQTYRRTLGKIVQKLTNTTGYHIFMTGLSGVTTVHIRLFGIRMIDVFFMLPLGL